MNFRHFFACIVIAAGCFLASCHSKIDLANVDPSAEVQMGLGLPIGTVQINITNFLGNVNNLYIDSLDNQGVITWKNTFDIARNYHELKLESYVPGAHIGLSVYDKLSGLPYFDNGKISTKNLPMDVPITLDFPLTVKLDGINSQTNVLNARLDSAQIETASFASVIKLKDGLPMEWEWIDSVFLDLGDRIKRQKGNQMLVYRKGDPQFSSCQAFGDSLETNVDNFSLVLMKNTNVKNYQDYANDNVVDECHFNIRFHFTIPKDTTLTIPSTSGFQYDLYVRFLTYKAVWGMFQPSNQMRAEEVQEIASNWNAAEFLTNSKLPFADPRIDVGITTQIAGAMRIDSAYIFAEDKDGNRTPALFGPNKREIVTKDLENWLPLTSAVGDSTTMHVKFDSTADGGRIQNLFRSIPKKIGYCFNVKFYQNRTPQIRITPNTSVHVQATATLPMVFDRGLHIKYSDTIQDISLSQFSIDSLVAQAAFIDSVKTSDVLLYMTAMNEIPMDLKATIRCYDKDGMIVTEPDDATKPFQLFTEDTLRLAAPKFLYNGKDWVMQSPGQTDFLARLSKERLNLFPKIKYIIYDVIIDDESLQSVFDEGHFNIRLTSDSRLQMKLGLTAQLDAFINLGATNGNNNNNNNNH